MTNPTIEIDLAEILGEIRQDLKLISSICEAVSFRAPLGVYPEHRSGQAQLRVLDNGMSTKRRAP